MIDIIGYTALSVNLISMAMKNTNHLRIISLIANIIYIIYGILLNAPPIYIGCFIAVVLHSYRIIQYKNSDLKYKKNTQINP